MLTHRFPFGLGAIGREGFQALRVERTEPVESFHCGFGELIGRSRYMVIGLPGCSLLLFPQHPVALRAEAPKSRIVVDAHCFTTEGAGGCFIPSMPRVVTGASRCSGSAFAAPRRPFPRRPRTDRSPREDDEETR